MSIIPKPVHPIGHGGATPLPLSVLREVVKTCGYDPKSKKSGPDGKSDHTTVQGLERTAFAVLGNSLMEWEQKLSARESGYNNPDLGRKVFLCMRPLLPKNVGGWLHANFIMDALRIYEEDEELSFALYGPYCCDFVFTKDFFKKRANKYAFVLGNGSVKDKSDYKGSHWTVLYIDILANQIDYYDSLGTFPSVSLRSSIENIAKVLSREYSFLTSEVNFTSRRKQTGGTECSVYVVHFVVQRLFGRSFKDFDKEYLPDKEIEKYRQVYWTVVDQSPFDFK